MIAKLITMGLPAIPTWMVHKVASRYVAGENKQDAIALAAKLQRQGFATTLDVLGEDVKNVEKARRSLSDYIDLMDAMGQAGVDRNISIKLTMLGLRIDEVFAFESFSQLLAEAAARDFFVCIDMEDSSVTDTTLKFYMRAKPTWPKLGTVLQARLRRTVEDAERLAAPGTNFRLCKGIYLEPETLAHQKGSIINDAFMDTLSILLTKGSYVAIATHDPVLIKRAGALLQAFPEYRGRYEYQALLGVPFSKTLKALRQAGNTVRIYIPFGRDWHAYSMRRLRENPDIALHIVKGLFSLDR